MRASNQDSFIVKNVKIGEQSALLAAVCDGVGGLACGDETSRKAAELLGKWADYELIQILSQEDFEELLLRRFAQLIREINKEIYYENLKMGIASGTTLTAILLWENCYMTGHVGDSRIYKVDESVHQITTDHSWISREMAAGRITPEEAEKDIRKNIILQCIGAEAEIDPELKMGEIDRNCTFILCTDGFWHQIKKEEWELYFSPLENDQRKLEKNLGYLFESVQSRGEKDNITAVVITVSV